MRVRYWWLVVITIILSACGFQLRSTGDSLNSSYSSIKVINNTNDTAFGQKLNQSLMDSGVVLSADSETVLEINSTDQEKRTASYSSRAKSAEYELIKQIAFVFRQGDTIITSNVIKSRRSYLYRETAAVGKAEEERLLREEMDQDLVHRILLALQQTTRSNTP